MANVLWACAALDVCTHPASLVAAIEALSEHEPADLDDKTSVQVWQTWCWAKTTPDLQLVTARVAQHAGMHSFVLDCGRRAQASTASTSTSSRTQQQVASALRGLGWV